MIHAKARGGKRRTLLIGLDCAEPSLVFGRWRDELPSLRWLMEHGAYGVLKSSIPCITVPAWSSMLSSKDPGVLGFYGFRNRVDHSYGNMRIATNLAMKEKRVWDYLSDIGGRSIVVGVPQTYPIQPLNGYMISSFLTPSTDQQYTYPDEFRAEIEKILQGQSYALDVRQFRTEDKDSLLQQIYDMTEIRFKVLNMLIREKSWDLFLFVEMGVDRIHHGFWRYQDPDHRLYTPGNKFENAIKEYYQFIDREIAHLLEEVDDNTVVLVVSDHGAKRMDGGFCINQWLHEEGYLKLKGGTPKQANHPFEETDVDWDRTIAWGAGGYYGRLWLNVRGREPNGQVSPQDYDRVRDELISKIELLPDHQGLPLHNVCFRPEEIYREVRNVAPDVIVYFGDLHWRSIGSLGYPSVYTFENDTGPDDANHAQDGLIIYYDPQRNLGGRSIEGAQLMDVAPTILDIMGQKVPSDMQGKVIAV